MKRTTRRLLSLLMAVVLCLGLTPVTAWAASFPSKFYASITLSTSSTSSTVESFGAVSGNGSYTKIGAKTDRVIYGMESAGGVFFTVEGNRGRSVSQGGGYIMEDDGWRELRMYNSTLTNYRTIGEVNEENGPYWIVDTAMDLSGDEPALYGTYQSGGLVGEDYVQDCPYICKIDLTSGKTSNWLQVTGLESGENDIIYAIAFDKNGVLYAIGADKAAEGGEASLYTIDLENVTDGAYGVKTVPASKIAAITSQTGSAIYTNFAQDLDFDHASGTLYWAENKGNVVYTVDTTTAVATQVGQVKYSNKPYPLQSFCIHKDTALGQNDDQYMVSVICEGAGTVTSNGENKPFYMVKNGDSIKLDIKFNEGGANSDLLGVTVDGKTVSIADLVNNSYTFENVTKNHVIEVKLKKEIPATQKTVTWFHYQGEPASFYTQHHVYKFYELPNRINPSLDDVPREGYTQTLLDENNNPIDNDEIITPGNYNVRVTHPGDDKYAALDVTYGDALQLAKCPGTPGRPVVYGKVGCTQGDLATTSYLQDYYGTDGELIDAAHDEIPVTLVWPNPETIYNEVGNFYVSATIYAADKLEQRLKDCYTLDDGSPLTEGKQISFRATQVVVLAEDEASLIKLQTSDASGGTVSGKGVYKNGDNVTVTATVNENAGYEFKGWQEGDKVVSDNSSYTFTANGDRTLTALFEAKSEYRVTLQTDPTDAGAVTGGGSYENEPHSATVKATPNLGYYFIGWYEAGNDTAVSTDAEYTFAVEEGGIALTAKFGIDYLARAEQAKENLESTLGKDMFEWATLAQAVDAYQTAADFVESPPSGIDNASDRYAALTTYYNGIKKLDLSNQGIGSADLAKLAIFTGVTDLNLSGNKGVTGLADLSQHMGQLATLDISGTGVTTADVLMSGNALAFASLTTLTANNLTLNSISALAQLVDADDFNADSVTKWDFTGSILPDTEGSKADVKAIQDELGGKFIPPTIKTTPTPGGGGGGAVTYGVVVADCEHGKISAEPAKAAQGDTVTISVTPDEGYELESLAVSDAGGKAVEVSRNDDGTFSFEMPASDVTVDASFAAVEPAPWESPYSDVSEADWFYADVAAVSERGVMAGYGGTDLFGPYDGTTRAMAATVIWRLAGEPEVDYAVPFADVEEGQWYTEAVRWAASTGITTGYGGTDLFGTDDPVTREQFATMLSRFAQAAGLAPVEPGDLSAFSDAAAVSEWGVEGMAWAVGAGVVRGVDDSHLAPQSGALRCELAAMLNRTIEGFDL